MKTKRSTLKKSDILYHVLKGWRIILLFTLVGLIIGISMIGAGYVRGEMTKEYRITSSVTVLALSKDNKFTSKAEVPGKTDIDVAKNITQEAMYIIKSKGNLKSVADSLKMRGVSAGMIAGNLSVTQVGETDILELSLMWRSEREGRQIMKAITDTANATMQNTMRIGGVAVINEPEASFIVGNNIGVSTWTYAALVGLALGVLFCIIRFIISPTVINADNLEEVFGLDLLASLPYDKKFAGTGSRLSDDTVINDDIKSLTHMLINRMKINNATKIYITSAVHDEGRTGIIANVALHLADLGKRTLLIDCDLSNPQLGAMFNNELKYEQTLNALYRGDSDKLDAVLNIKGCLDLLPVILEKNPESFNDAMLGSLADVMEGYDYVLIDAAPVGEDAEVLRLNEICDAVLFVVRSDFASLDIIKTSLTRLDKSGIPVIGGVFNALSGWKAAFSRTKKQMDKMEKKFARKSKKEKKKAAKKQGK